LKIARKNSKNTGLSYAVEIFRVREWSGGWRGKWRARGPHTMPRRGLALAAPPCGVVAWWVPLGCPRCLSAPFLHKILKRTFWNFLRNFIFEDFSKIDKRIKLGKTKVER
jgi:hypothetical protein